MLRSIVFISLLLFSLSSFANSFPMTRFNYQGYAIDEEKAKEREEDPNLVKIFTDPDLYLVLNKLIDQFDPEHQQPFRIHQGSLNDLDKLLDDGYTFDLLFTGRLEDAQQLGSNLIHQVQLFANGFLALWAPGETSRSLKVLKLQNSPIARVNESSAYYPAVDEALRSAKLDLIVKSRLTTVGLFDDVYEKIAQQEFTSGFLPFSHLVEAGIEKHKDVLLIDPELYTAILHGMALTNNGQYQPAAVSFWEFILSPQGKKLIQAAGFE